MFKKYFKKLLQLIQKLSSKIISLPLHPMMLAKDVIKITETIKNYFNAKN